MNFRLTTRSLLGSSNAGKHPVSTIRRIILMQPHELCLQHREHALHIPICDLLAKATPLRSGDALAGIAAESAAQRVARNMPSRSALATSSPSKSSLRIDESRASSPTPRRPSFAPVRSLTWASCATGCSPMRPPRASPPSPRLTPRWRRREQLMRVQDLSPSPENPRRYALRTTVGLPGRLSARFSQPPTTIQPHRRVHPRRLTLGSATRHRHQPAAITLSNARLLRMIDNLRRRLRFPSKAASSPTSQRKWSLTQARVDLLFQSIAHRSANAASASTRPAQ